MLKIQTNNKLTSFHELTGLFISIFFIYKSENFMEREKEKKMETQSGKFAPFRQLVEECFLTGRAGQKITDQRVKAFKAGIEKLVHPANAGTDSWMK